MAWNDFQAAEKERREKATRCLVFFGQVNTNMVRSKAIAEVDASIAGVKLRELLVEYIALVEKVGSEAKKIFSAIGLFKVSAYPMGGDGMGLAPADGNVILSKFVRHLGDFRRKGKKARVEMIDQLIVDATDEGKLSSMFEGWCAWF